MKWVFKKTKTKIKFGDVPNIEVGSQEEEERDWRRCFSKIEMGLLQYHLFIFLRTYSILE